MDTHPRRRARKAVSAMPAPGDVTDVAVAADLVR
jgi:hypothetical protein